MEQSIRERVFLSTVKNRQLFSAVIELTKKCNWRCRHCYIPEYFDGGMGLRDIEAMLVQLRELGVFEVTLTGGEILTRPDIMEIVKKARRLRLSVILFSNISLMTDELVTELANSGVSEISCTIFSMKKSVHDSITRVNGSLEAALKSALLIKERGIPLTIKTIILNENCNEWSAVREYCSEMGFRFMIDHDIFYKQDRNASPEDLRITPSQIIDNIKDYDALRGFTPGIYKGTDYVCGGIQNAVYIDCNGKVYPCNKFMLEVGDIKMEPLRNVWYNSEELKRLQNMTWKDLRKCPTCMDAEYCQRCPGTAWLEDGDEYGPSSMSCKKAHYRKRAYRGANA